LRYISTRGKAPRLAFDDVLLAGLAADGGLYVPERWPAITGDDLDNWRGLSYPALAARVIAPFVGGTIPEDVLGPMVGDAYAGFDHPDVAPLVDLGDGMWLMELFHGPTLAFKDYALQLLGRLFDHVLEARGERITIVGATSGDTGSAAIAACRDRAHLDIFILHPRGRVSEVQRRQMTTVPSANVHNLAVEGTFDDCQDLVKALFNDAPTRKELKLSAVNSINWARIMAQTVYYVWAALKLGVGKDGLAFAVPTGNFGNVYAGYAAREMGLPVRQLVVGSNRNDILTRFFETGAMEMRAVEPSLSPSMDIQISSNFERLLFDLLDRDGGKVAAVMDGFRKTGRFALDEAVWRKALALFDGARLSDPETIQAIRALHEEAGVTLDPHSVVGVMAGRAKRRDAKIPMVALATAHPAKFPDAVAEAVGVRPALPPHMADLFERRESYAVVPNDLDAVRAFIRERARILTDPHARKKGAA
jgi:threonine synthase